jgi:hypothetical protein
MATQESELNSHVGDLVGSIGYVGPVQKTIGNFTQHFVDTLPIKILIEMCSAILWRRHVDVTFPMNSGKECIIMPNFMCRISSFCLL